MLKRKETLKSQSRDKKRKDKTDKVKSGERLEGIPRKSKSVINLKFTVHCVQFN